MVSTLLASKEMRAGVDRQAPISSRPNHSTTSTNSRLLSHDRNRARLDMVARSTTHTVSAMGFVRRPSGNGLVEGDEIIAPKLSDLNRLRM